MADPVQRRLAAILAVDVVGYSRLMGEDEEGTLAALTAHRTELIEPCITEHRGRVVKTTGDGLLAEFASVVDAVRCAVAFQEGMADRNTDTAEDGRIAFRIGVNLGDIIVQDDDVYGDGVNVAARLEGLAEPGGIVVSSKVHEEVRDKIDLSYTDLGSQEVKNIARPVLAFAVDIFRQPVLDRTKPLSLPDKPSIAVLAFDNLSGDPEQEYFSDGIAEDIITDLSNVAGLFVIARNSSFTFKGQNSNIREIGEQLGVKYILEGSVRKAGNRVRINAKLIDAPTAGQIWAQRYDGDLEDMFSLQDEITRKIVTALEVNLTAGGPDVRAQVTRTDLETYDLFMRARRDFYQFSPESMISAKDQLEEVVAKDATFAPAYAFLSFCYFAIWHFILTGDESVRQKALDTAQKAVEIAPTSGFAQGKLGWVLTFLRRYDEALDRFESAIVLSPNDADIFGDYGEVLNYVGKPEKGLEMIEHGMRIDPLGPASWDFHRGHSYYKMQRYDEAITAIRHSISRNPSFPVTYLFLAVIYSELGQDEKAVEMVNNARKRVPKYSIETVSKIIVHKSEAEMDRFLTGLRAAGMPEC